MKITIEIPKEYEDEFLNNRFKESLNRAYVDLDYYKENTLCGVYERETLDMLRKAFENAIVESDTDTLNKIVSIVNNEKQSTSCEHTKLKSFDMIDNIITEYLLHRG